MIDIIILAQFVEKTRKGEVYAKTIPCRIRNRVEGRLWNS